MIVVVTGSRYYADYSAVKKALDGIHASTPITELRHGAARGADTLAACWATEHGVIVRPFEAQWAQYGSMAGPIRNRRMLDADPAPGLLVAFPLANSQGTWGCVREAELRGIPTTVIQPRSAA